MFSRLLAAAALTFAGPIVERANAQCFHNGTLPGSETWDSACVHVITGHVTVAAGDTLRLLAGAIVKLQDYRALLVDGTLLASGTAGSPILITSWHDDTAGGDTNNNGGATVPGGTLRWNSIQFRSQSHGQLDHCVVRWGGRNAGGGSVDWRPMVDLQASGFVSIANSVLEQTQSDVMRCQGGARPAIVNTTIQNGGGSAIEIDASSLVPTIVSLTLASNAINGIEIPGGTVSASSALANMGVPYAITEHLTIASGATLELPAGVVIKLRDYRALLVDGTLLASGTVGSPVYLTSLHDDTVGGDTNNNGGATVPGGTLRWNSIQFRSQSHGQLDHCVVRWGGRNAGGANVDWRPMVDLQASGFVSIANSVLEQTQSDVMRCQGGARPAIVNTTIQNGGGSAIEIDVASLVPQLDNVTVQSNGINGIEIPGGTVSTNSALPKMSVPYVITEHLTVAPGVTLELFSGTIVKLQDYKSLLVDGTVFAHGWSPIYFTSLHDDTLGGDTNGNGGATAPGGTRRWNSIQFRSQGRAMMSRCWVRWGGRNAGGGSVDYRPMIQFTGSGDVGEIVDSNVSDYQQVGIDVTSPVSHLTITGCNLNGDNTQFAIQYVAGGTDVTATGNWWGDASGPLDLSTGLPDYNPSGLGRKVSDHVVYRQWLTTPVCFPCPTSTEDQGVVASPRSMTLHQNAPNPFNPTTTIHFDLTRGGRVQLTIFDVKGALVRTLLDRDLPPRGYDVVWNAFDNQGRRVASGTYLYQLQVDGIREVRKMMVLK